MHTFLRIISHICTWGIKVAITDLKMNIHLLLSQDQHSLWFDGMVWCQIFPISPHHSILKGFPHPVTGGPRDAEVMPFAVVDEERKLCNLQQRHCASHDFLESEQSLFHTLVAESLPAWKLNASTPSLLPAESPPLSHIFPSIKRPSVAHLSTCFYSIPSSGTQKLSGYSDSSEHKVL